MGAEEICDNSENLKENSNAIQNILEDSFNENVQWVPTFIFYFFPGMFYVKNLIFFLYLNDFIFTVLLIKMA